MSESGATRAVATLTAWAKEDAEGRVMTVVEDPSILDYVGELLAERVALLDRIEHLERQIAGEWPYDGSEGGRSV